MSITGEKLLKIPTYGGWSTRCWITNKSQKKSKNMRRTNENENTTTQNLWDTKSSTKGKVHSNTGLPQETRKKSSRVLIGKQRPKCTTCWCLSSVDTETPGSPGSSNHRLPPHSLCIHIWAHPDLTSGSGPSNIVAVELLSCIQLFVTPWTAAHPEV